MALDDFGLRLPGHFARFAEAGGNIAFWTEIEGVVYSVSRDAVVRTHDAETGLLVDWIRYPSQEKALDVFNRTIEIARRIARPAGGR